MKKKVLLLILTVFLISILAGCEPQFLDGEDEEEGIVEQIVYDYWMAMMNRQYELAKQYCIPGGVWDHKTDELEECINANSEGDAFSNDLFYLPLFY